MYLDVHDFIYLKTPRCFYSSAKRLKDYFPNISIDLYWETIKNTHTIYIAGKTQTMSFKNLTIDNNGRFLYFETENISYRAVIYKDDADLTITHTQITMS